MELKNKYQYTYFVYPYVIDETKYEKYILKLFRDKKCEFRIFQKEKDFDMYSYFLPQVRTSFFPTFELRDEKLKEFEHFRKDKKAKIVAKQNCACFSYYLDKDIEGNVDNGSGIFFNIEKIDIICFKTGICFFAMKTLLNPESNFTELLDFNYKFRDINTEFLSLKNFENIKIKTDIFEDVSDIAELISKITGTDKNQSSLTKELSNSQFYTYSYSCIERDYWNERNSFQNLENEFYKYANVLPSNYASDFNKANIEHNLYILDSLKYTRTGVTKLSSNIICSGIDTYNFTKLPYEYENQYFFTYILSLYQKIFLKKMNLEFKDYKKISTLREKFISFTKVFWEQEITLNDNGNLYYRALKRVLELDDIYDEVKRKYEVIYKDLNIERNNVYYSVIMVLLVISLIFNCINITVLLLSNR